MPSSMRQIKSPKTESWPRLCLLPLLAFQEGDPDALTRLQHNLSLQAWVAAIYRAHVTLDLLKGLEEADDCVAHFGESELLSNADTGSAIEC